MKRSKKMLLMVLALVVLAGGYALVTSLNKTTAVTEETGSYPVLALAADDVTGLSYTSGDETVTLTKSDAGWAAADAALSVNQSSAQAMVDSLTALVGSRELTGITDLGGYGLSEPAFTVTLTGADGTKSTLSMGDATPLGSEYYVKSSASDSVYTVSTALDSVCSHTLLDLAVKETLPSIGTTVSRIVYGTTLDQTRDAASDTWLHTDTRELSDTSKVQTLLAHIEDLDWDSLVTWNAADSELTTYGLDEDDAAVLAVDSVDDEGTALTYRLLLGVTEEMSGNVYARLPESRMVYLLDASTLADITGTTDESLRDLAVFTATADQLGTAVLSWSGSEHTLTRATEVTLADSTATPTDTTDTSSETITVHYVMDGSEVDAESAENMLTTLLSLTATGVTDSSVSGDAVLSVKLTLIDGTSHEVVLSTYDADSYVVESMDASKLLVSADTVDKLIRTVKTLVP